MPENSNEKAQKLAAARKKLKEFQRQRYQDATSAVSTKIATPDDIVAVASNSTSTGGSIASNLSERSESELNLNNGNTPPTDKQLQQQHSRNPSDDGRIPSKVPECRTVEQNMQCAEPNVGSYFSTPAASGLTADDIFKNYTTPSSVLMNTQPADANLNAIQVLIAEKAQLNSELTKARGICRERELELEELRTQYTSSQQRYDDLQTRCAEQQRTGEQLRKNNAELQHKLAQSRAHSEDQQAHLDELQSQLTLEEKRASELNKQLTEKSNELEMAQLKLRQLYDESHVSNDNRIETLTQTQYMYEQQIRDLQAMVQQLTQDKEQANTQYQNYVQHLNGELSKVNERNAEVTEEKTRLQERERQLVAHVSGLEREIQKNLALQKQYKEQQDQDTTVGAPADDAESLKQLKERLADFDFERHEFQLKIKSQDDKVLELEQQLLAKTEALDQLEAQLERVQAEQPDQTKLLATMESDKVAASRALTQNIEMKKQLDELEQRFVQLTNDKAELVNKLDAEEFANREMRTKFTKIEQQLHEFDDRFKFKDEEMIRLSHENVELERKNLQLQQQLNRLKHYEVQRKRSTTSADKQNSEHDHDNEKYAEQDPNEATEAERTISESCIEATEDAFFAAAKRVQEIEHNRQQYEHNHNDHDDHHQDNDHDDDHQHDHTQQHNSHAHLCGDNSQIPTDDAVEKLQQRFTQLISQVAELTDEKQRLEHLVMQLQSETETIGEYIALYQTQRRMLKQREYEKAAQMRLLQTEREQLREKITLLNQLVSSLGGAVDVSSTTQQQQQQHQQLQNLKAVEAFAKQQQIELAADEQDGDVSGGSGSASDSTPQTPATPPSTPATAGLGSSTATSNISAKPLESQQIINKIQNLITEIKADTEHVPTVQHTVDHLNCCLGKFEVV